MAEGGTPTSRGRGPMAVPEILRVFSVNEHDIMMTPLTYNVPHTLIFEEFRYIVGPALRKVPIAFKLYIDFQ
jgi:hypothetical protein